KSIVDDNILALNPPELAQPLPERVEQGRPIGRERHPKETYPRHLSRRLLRARRERPRCRRAAEKRDELAPPHGSSLRPGTPEQAEAITFGADAVLCITANLTANVSVGSKAVRLEASKCFPLCLRKADLRSTRPPWPKRLRERTTGHRSTSLPAIN